MFESRVTTGIDTTTDGRVEIDARLIERIREGDALAVDALYRRHASSLLAYLTSFAGDREVAEEILQDTFVAAWHAAARYQARSSVRTWLYGIARRQAMNTLRRKSLPVTDDSELDTLSGTEPGPEQVVIAGARRQVVHEAISALSPIHREVLTLVFEHELSYDEIAVVLGVPNGTVKSRLSNARRALRSELARSEDI